MSNDQIFPLVSDLIPSTHHFVAAGELDGAVLAAPAALALARVVGDAVHAAPPLARLEPRALVDLQIAVAALVT